jgi:hypothetical protein
MGIARYISQKMKEFGNGGQTLDDISYVKRAITL